MSSRVSRLCGILFISLFFCCPLFGGTEFNNKNILMLSSDNASNFWNQRLMEGLRDSLGKTGISMSLDILELNIDGTPDLRPRQAEINSLKARLNLVDYSLIIVSGNAAADLFFDKQVAIPDKTPLLFFNYQGFLLNNRKQFPGMTGIMMPHSSARDIRMGLKFFPKTEKVAVVLDGGVNGNSIRMCIMAEKWPESVKLEFIDGLHYSTAEMLRKLKELPENSFVVMNRWQSNKEPTSTRPEKMLPVIQKYYSGPIFATLEYQMDFDVLGGFVGRGFQQGEQAGKLAARILKGEKPESIPITVAASQLLFNDPQLKKFGIPRTMLPAGAKILNQPEAWYANRQKELLWAGISLGILLVLSLGGMLFFLRLSRWSYMVSERFRLTLESIGDAVIATDANEIIKTVNPVAAHLCGLSEAQMIGCNAGDVLRLVRYPDNDTVESPLRIAIRENRIVELSNHTDLISADGHRYHVADSAAPIRNGAGKVIGAVIVFRDVTQEYQQSVLLRNAKTSLEYGSELTCSAAYRMNVRTREITGSKLLPEIWPIRDGKAIPWEEYVHPDDLPEFRRTTERLLRHEGEDDIETWNFRADHLGELRHYRMRATLDWSNPAEPYLIGVMQDVTEIVHTTSRLQEATDLWEMVINSIPVKFFAKDADDNFRYVLCNQAYADFHGKSKDEIIGHTDAELFLRPEDAEWFRQKDIEIMNKTDGESFEETVCDGNGNMVDCQTVKKPFCGNGGRRLLLGVFQDVSRLQQLIASEHFNSEMLAYALGEPEPRLVFDYMADRLIQHMKCERIILARCNEAGQLRHEKEWLSENVTEYLVDGDMETHYRIWDENIHLMHEKRIVTIPDISEHPTGRYLKHDPEFKNGSVIIAPVFVENKLWGALFVFHGSHHAFSEMDERIMRSCGNLISLALLRELQNRRISLYERETQLILDNINIPITLHSADGKLLHVNAAVSRMTGLSVPQLLNSPENEVFYLGEKLPADTPLKQIIAGGRSATVDQQIGGRQYILRADAVIDDNGKLINIIKSAIDVTELNEMIASEQIISRTLTQVALENSFEKNLKLVLEQLSSRVHSDRVSFVLYDREQERYTLSEVVSRDTELSPITPEMVDTLFREADETIRHKKIFRVDDTRASGYATLLGRFPIRSILAAPVYVRGELWAVIAVASRQVHEFSTVEQNLMRSMANIVALAEIRDQQNRAIRQADFEKQMILNNIGIPIWLYDAEGCFLRANTAVGKLAGVDAERLNPQMDRDIFCEGLKDWKVRPTDEAIATQRSVHRELVWRGRNFKVAAEPTFDTAGQLQYIVKSAVDVTELNTLLRDQRVINSCLENLFSTEDVETAIEALLKIFCEYFKGTRCYILKFDLKHGNNSLFAEYAVPGARKMFEKGVEYPLTTIDPWLEAFKRRKNTLITDVRSQENRAFIGEWSAGYIDEFNMRSLFVSPIYLRDELWGDIGIIYENEPCGNFSGREEGMLDAVSHLVEVVLERKESRDQLIRAMEQAQNADRAKSYFLATMSHELRTPLNAVIDFSELLQDENVSREDQLDYLRSINCAGETLLALINDVLDLSKLEAAQVNIAPVKTDLNALLNEMIAVFQLKAKQKNLSLTVETTGIRYPVYVDPLRIRQILLNLIGNAIKFTHKGGITITGSFMPDDRTSAGELFIQVADTGIGICEKQIQKIFEPFFQVDAVRGSRAYEGSGLGLAISVRLAQRMGGVIDVVSKPDQGSMFTIHLKGIRYEPEPSTDSATARESLSGSTAPAQLRVLVVDDVSMNLKVLQAMLRKLNVESVCTISGAEALRILRQDQKFNCVLTDLWMPEMDGEQLADAIRAISGVEAIKVIAVTADTEARSNFSTKKFDDILAKPVTFEALRKLLLYTEPPRGEEGQRNQ